jgi:CTP synthase (UTP-ammonia lyase)
MNDLLKIGIIGDFDANRPSHKATNEALRHCAENLSMPLQTQWLATESVEGDVEQDMAGYDAFWCAPGSPYRSFKGAINAIRFAREHRYPFIGTCGGFQHAVMEYALNVLKMVEVNHAEYNPDASTFFITALSCSLVGETRRIFLKEGSLVRTIYGKDATDERYNCNFGLNADFQATFDQSGFRVAGTDANGEVRIFELASSRFYVATLFQPQLSSTLEAPHPLILEYLRAAREFHCALAPEREITQRHEGTKNTKSGSIG